MAVKRSFSRAIVYSRRLSKGKVDLMVLFMMDNHCDLFKVSASRLAHVCVETAYNFAPLTHQIPVSLHQLVSSRLMNMVNGKDPDMATGSNIWVFPLFFQVFETSAPLMKFSCPQVPRTAAGSAPRPIQNSVKRPPKRNSGPCCGRSTRTPNSPPRRRGVCWDSFTKATRRSLFSTLGREYLV